MIKILIVCLFAYASAAPQYRDLENPFGSSEHSELFGIPDHYYYDPRGYEVDSLFDTQRYYSQLSHDLSVLDRFLEQFTKHFPSSINTVTVEENNYIIKISLPNYKEDDIIIKAREGLVMIQAVHKINEVTVQQYLDIRTLPQNVNPAGSWTYDKEILKLTFPLNNNDNDNETTTVAVIENKSREEMGENDTEETIEVTTTVKPKIYEYEIETNEINNNEKSNKNQEQPTTYAIDPKNDVEFVPVAYKK